LLFRRRQAKQRLASSGKFSKHRPFKGTGLYFRYGVFHAGGIATPREAVNALRGLLGGTRRTPGMSLIAGRCELWSRVQRQVGAAIFQGCGQWRVPLRTTGQKH
jgi:hypothetical protein